VGKRLAATQTQFDTIAANLAHALALIEDCHRAYVEASDHVKRLFNQALFTQILVHKADIAGVLAEPFRTLVGPDLQSLLTKRRSSVLTRA
jgi:hypothetical protein